MSCGDVGITNERSHCVYCDGRFSLMINLLRHKRAHRQEPFWSGRSHSNRRIRHDACDTSIRFYTKKSTGTVQTGSRSIMLFSKVCLQQPNSLGKSDGTSTWKEIVFVLKVVH